MAGPSGIPVVDPNANPFLHAKFAKFNITTTPYKTVSGQEIPVYVFIPKNITPGPHPVLARFHGGFLITGGALIAEFTAQWALDYAVLHSAIWVTPDYRLLPESKGTDVLEDMKDFWTWTREKLPAYLESIGSAAEPDYAHIMAYGESAGGWLALQTALTVPNVKAVIAAFPMVDVDQDWYSKKAGNSPFEAPEVPKELLEKHIADTPKGKIVTSALPPDRVPLALVAIQQGLYTDMLGREEDLFPLKVLEKLGKEEKRPFVFTYHGTEDRAVPDTGTREFAKKWEEKFGAGSIKATFMPGDHGVGEQDGLEEPWLKEGLEGVTKAWLA